MSTSQKHKNTKKQNKKTSFSPSHRLQADPSPSKKTSGLAPRYGMREAGELLGVERTTLAAPVLSGNSGRRIPDPMKPNPMQPNPNQRTHSRASRGSAPLVPFLLFFAHALLAQPIRCPSLSGSTVSSASLCWFRLVRTHARTQRTQRTHTHTHHTPQTCPPLAWGLLCLLPLASG